MPKRGNWRDYSPLSDRVRRLSFLYSDSSFNSLPYLLSPDFHRIAVDEICGSTPHLSSAGFVCALHPCSIFRPTLLLKFWIQPCDVVLKPSLNSSSPHLELHFVRVSCSGVGLCIAQLKQQKFGLEL